MKFGLIADIHGNNIALAAALRMLDGQVDHIVFLGDICGYYPFVNECIEMLRVRQVIGIRGNHDQVLIDCLATGKPPADEYRARYGSALDRAMQVLSDSALKFLHSWPTQRELLVESRAILATHGAPWDSLEGRVYPDFENWSRFDPYMADICLLGHTHYPLVKHHHNKLIANPGSVGQARDRAGEASYGILDVITNEVMLHRVPFNPEILICDARKHDPNLPYLERVLTR
ncbi:MAG TPA: metallophosphoesterase family protein [Opitutaceae bacterium]|nr:metallophosphoesterase family protein [Opitutaceae bacterium]